MKKSHLLLILSILFVFVLAACSEEESGDVMDEDNSNDGGTEDTIDAGDEDSVNIAVVLKGADQEYFKLAEAGAKAAFEDFEVNGKLLSASKETQEQELINLLEDLSTESPDAMVVMPSTEAAVPTLEKYAEKDTPVLLIDTDLDWDKKLTYIGTDNYTAGQKGGEYLTTLISEGDEVAIIEGVSGAAQNEARVGGAKDYFEENGFEVVTVQAANFDRTEAVSIMENIITAHPDVKGIFAANDEMALGASQVVETSGADVKIVGVDGTTDALVSIADGELDGSVQQLPYEMAYTAVEKAIEALDGEEIDQNIDSGIDLITSDNAADILDTIKEQLGK